VDGRDDAVLAKVGPAEADRAARTPPGGAQGRRLAGERLRRAILAGDMAPGQRLVEEELAGLFGVTRASLRGALFDLAADAAGKQQRGHESRAVTMKDCPPARPFRPATSASHILKQLHNVR